MLGLVRDIVCLQFFGTALWDCFVIPFQIPNLFRRLFGEGALSAALIPVYTERLHKDKAGAKLLVRRVVTLLVLVLGGLTLLGIGLAWLYGWLRGGTGQTWVSVRLTTILLPYAVLICVVGVLGGVLNVHRRFGAPAASPIVLNLCMLGGVLGFAWWGGANRWPGLYVVAGAVIVAGVLQVGLQLMGLRREGVTLRPSWEVKDEGVKAIMRLMGPMIIGLSAMQINALLDTVIARMLSATSSTGPGFMLWGRMVFYPVTEGAVSALYFAQRLYQFPLGVFGIALSTAIFPHLSTAALHNDRKGFGEALNQGIRLVIFIGLPAMVGMILVRGPLTAIFVGGRFEAADSAQTAWTLLFYALGIGAYCLQHVVVRGFYAFKDSVTPVRLAVRMIGLNLVLNLVLIWPLGTGGLALSTAVCATIQVGVLLIILVKRHDLRIGGGVAGALLRTGFATVVMGAGCWLAIYWVAGQKAWWQLLVGVLVAAVLFAGASVVMRSKELRELLGRK